MDVVKTFERARRAPRREVERRGIKPETVNSNKVMGSIVYFGKLAKLEHGLEPVERFRDDRDRR